MNAIAARTARRLWSFLAVFLFLWRPAFSGEIPLSIDDAVRMAIDRNLDLRSAVIDTGIARDGALRATAIYDPRVSALLQHQGENARNTPPSSSVDRSRTFEADFGADWLLRTGATASANSRNVWNDADSGNAGSGGSIDRTVRPELSVSLSQPLLKGFGRDVTERGITTANDARDAADDAWRTAAENLAARARNQFAALVKAREALATRDASLELARRIHAENEARVRAGVLAPVELLDSELGIAQREKDLIDAEKAVQDANDQLRVLLQAPPPGEIVPVLPDILPSPDPESEEESVRNALALRADVRRARTLQRSTEFQARVSENLALPSLDLKGGMGIFGLSPETGNAFDRMARADSTFWTVGLNFSVPIGNTAARADLSENRLKAAQSRLTLRSIEETAALEARTAVRGVSSSRKQVEVSEKNVKLAETRLASYLKRARVGLATTKDLLQAETDLSTAKQGLSSSRSDFMVAVTELWRSTGRLLSVHGVAAGRSEIESLSSKELP